MGFVRMDRNRFAEVLESTRSMHSKYSNIFQRASDWQYWPPSLKEDRHGICCIGIAYAVLAWG